MLESDHQPLAFLQKNNKDVYFDFENLESNITYCVFTNLREIFFFTYNEKFHDW